MPERDERAVSDFVEHTALTMTEFGFPRMSARVLLTLMASDADSMSAQDLAGALGVSAAAISGAVRNLTQVRLVERVAVKGSRRDHYRLPDQAWFLTSVTKSGWIDRLADLAEQGTAAVGGPATAAGHRTSEMAEFYRFIARDMDGMLDRWQAHRGTS